jgi:O-antigen ligase
LKTDRKPSFIFFLIGTLLLSLNLVRPFGLAVSDWFFFTSMALAMIETIIVDTQNRALWFKNRFLWFAFLILLGGVVSLVNAQNYKVAIFEIVQQLYVVTVFISLIWIMVKRGHMKKIVFALILSGVFAAGIASIDSLTGSRLGATLSNAPGVQFWGRYAGPLGHPNKLGYFLVITSILTLPIIRENKAKGLRILYAGLFLLQVFGIYLSGSVTAFIGFILAFIALIFASFKKRTAPIKVFTGLIVIILVVTSMGILSGNSSVLRVFQTVWDNIDRSINRVQLSTANSRMVIYQEALKKISESPFIGVGFDQISTSGITNRLLDVHNVFIQIWYVGGLLAFIGLLGLYIWLGISVVKILLQSHLDSHPQLITALASVTAAVILMDQFQDALYQREKWLVFGLFSVYLWSINRRAR